MHSRRTRTVLLLIVIALTGLAMAGDPQNVPVSLRIGGIVVPMNVRLHFADVAKSLPRQAARHHDGQAVGADRDRAVSADP